MIQFKGVSKHFGPLCVLDSIDLEIIQGRVTTIIGRSGVGKSVLLKHIIGLLRPDSGEVMYQGRDLNRMSRAERKNRRMISISTRAPRAIADASPAMKPTK